MLRATLALLGLLAAPVVAADFRGTELGSSCDQITEREALLGSTLQAQSQPAGNGYRFVGRAFDLEVTIIYLCDHGVLRHGSYRFSDGNLDSALQFFRTVYLDLSSQFGPVSQEIAVPNEHKTPSLPPEGSVPPPGYMYMASWESSEGAQVGLFLTRDQFSQELAWSVTMRLGYLGNDRSN